jgi:hypothetical protein
MIPDTCPEDPDCSSSELSPKKYFWGAVGFAFALLLSISAIGSWGIFFNELFGYQVLYNYQLDKVSKLQQVDTVFVGDSSLGNAIDSALFTDLTGSSSVNLALTGNYGYAGAYNMVKKLEGKGVRNLVVMTSINNLTQPISYEGYLLTMKGIEDVRELSVKERSELVSAFYSLILSPDNFQETVSNFLGFGQRNFRIVSDYVEQGEFSDPRGGPNLVESQLNPKKTLFLAKLVRYCARQDIRLIHLHGPIFENTGLDSYQYLEHAAQVIDETGAMHLPETVMIPLEAIGDSSDHVHPGHKGAFTARFVALLKPHLR